MEEAAYYSFGMAAANMSLRSPKSASGSCEPPEDAPRGYEACLRELRF